MEKDHCSWRQGCVLGGEKKNHFVGIRWIHSVDNSDKSFSRVDHPAEQKDCNGPLAELTTLWTEGSQVVMITFFCSCSASVTLPTRLPNPPLKTSTPELQKPLSSSCSMLIPYTRSQGETAVHMNFKKVTMVWPQWFGLVVFLFTSED